uniref:Uncharacterized protein n=1 Tax=Tanacetum cinerariifolium TaxID=118510 RepID=A0A6L2LWP2_TANCI|nr:hypothetical protein [Tanacetum cinerariifolium]
MKMKRDRKDGIGRVISRYQALKRKPQTEAQARKNMMVYLKNMARFKMDFFKGMTYDEIRPIFEKHFNSIVDFLEKEEEELEEEESKVIKRKSKSSKEKAAKKQKLDEEVEELKTHLQIVPNDENDVYTEATPLALKVLVVDYQIHTENNKPYYKIIRADGIHQLFLSFISLLRNFDREYLEMLWKNIQEIFASSEPTNFSDDFLLNTLKTMFEKPNVEAHIWKNQRGSYGLARVKSWKLLESYGVYIITFTTTQMIFLVERRYPLTRFTLDQMLNNVILEVEEESEVLLELLKFISFRCYMSEIGVLQIGIRAMVIENKVVNRVMTSPNHPTTDIEDAFFCNFPNYTTASPSYFPALPRNISPDPPDKLSKYLLASLVISPFHNMQAYNAVANKPHILPQDPITPPTILTSSLVIPPLLLFDPRYFFVPEELLPPKKQIHPPSSSSTTLSDSSRKQACIIVPPSFSTYTPTPPQIYELGKSSIKMRVKHHEEQVKSSLNYLEELSFHRIKKMEERLVNGWIIIPRDFDEVKTKLKKART